MFLGLYTKKEFDKLRNEYFKLKEEKDGGMFFSEWLKLTQKRPAYTF